MNDTFDFSEDNFTNTSTQNHTLVDDLVSQVNGYFISTVVLAVLLFASFFINALIMGRRLYKFNEPEPIQPANEPTSDQSTV